MVVTHIGAEVTAKEFKDSNMLKIINISIMFYVIILDRSTNHV